MAKWVRTQTNEELCSIYGQSKTIEDSEKMCKNMFAEDGHQGKTWKVNYAVHEKLDGAETRFIGLVSLFSLEGGRGLPLPDDLTLTKAQQVDTLAIEAAYAFLPAGWGKGYATESVNAMLAEAKRARDVWKPWEKVYVRAMVNAENPASLRVMAKTDMKRRGEFEWKGQPIYLAGEWRVTGTLVIWGMMLVE